MKDLLSIVSKFKVQGTVGEIKPLGAGLINDTYKVNTTQQAEAHHTTTIYSIWMARAARSQRLQVR